MRQYKGKALWKAKAAANRAWRYDRRKENYDLGAVDGGNRWWSDSPIGWGPHKKKHRRMRSLIRLWMLDRLPYPRERADLWCNLLPVPPEQGES